MKSNEIKTIAICSDKSVKLIRDFRVSRVAFLSVYIRSLFIYIFDRKQQDARAASGH